MTRPAALVIVDVQRHAVALEPWHAEVVLGNIATLLAAAREAGTPVVHVQHDGLPGEDPRPGTDGWQLHFPAREGEKLVRKRFNSAFRGTDLHAHLHAKGLTDLILVGIQTEYCVDTTCRVAFELGYHVLMPEGTNTTFDRGGLSAGAIVEHFNREIFHGRFADVCPLEDALSVIARQPVG